VGVRQIDPHDEDAFDAWYAVMEAVDNELWPGKPGWQRSERLVMALDGDGPEEHRCLSAFLDTDTDTDPDPGPDTDPDTDTGPDTDDPPVVGIADLTMYRRENSHLAELSVAVLGGARRQGVGTALVAEAARLARQAGRRELGGMDEVPVRPGYESASAAFAGRLGFAPAQHMVKRELRVPLSPDHMLALTLDPRSSPPGYSLITFADRWPDAFIEDRCEFGRRMSTDAPLGDQERDEEVWDEARVRHIEVSLAAQNRAKITTAAVHDATRRLVAFTEIAVPLGAPESSWQHDTLVIREHRGHSLGFATKATNLAAVMAAYPAIRRISTWNAAENTYMIAVNDAMGFEVVAHSTFWTKELGATSS
jgi:GNAT superfamily N-acetyltransferase